MTYQETLNWMFSQLAMYQKQGKTAFKGDLSNTVNLVNHLNNPEKDFKSVHVAGTNGKGSSSHMIASVLQEAGYKVGLYTSPHLKDFRERIKINGEVISEEAVISFVKQNKPFFNSNSLSFFEMTVGMAFQYFSREKVDVAVIEVGLGGRLDSTNIITPEVSVITNIGIDHTQFLGNTLDVIAFEKGGIIKPNIPVVIGETQKETVPVFLKLANEQQAEIVFADQEIKVVYTSDLKGSYQSKNIKTVVQTIKVLKEEGFKIKESDLKVGLNKVVENTGLLGRWQILSKKPKVVCDTGHNKEGLTYVFEQINKEVFNELHIVFGVVNDKDLDSIVHVLPKNAKYYFCKPEIFRGLNAELLKETFLPFGLKGNAYDSVNEAYNQAKKDAKESDFIFVGGSTFVVAEII